MINNNNRFRIKQENIIKTWLPCYKLERNRIVEGEIKTNKLGIIRITNKLKYDIDFINETDIQTTTKNEKFIQLRINSLESLFNTISVNRTTVQKKQDLIYTWEIMKQAYSNKYFVKGRILNPIKGGFAVGLSGVVAFLPLRYSTITTFGKLNIFYIVSVDQKKNMIIISQKNLNKRVHRILRKLASRLIFLNQLNNKTKKWQI